MVWKRKHLHKLKATTNFRQLQRLTSRFCSAGFRCSTMRTTAIAHFSVGNTLTRGLWVCKRTAGQCYSTPLRTSRGSSNDSSSRETSSFNQPDTSNHKVMDPLKLTPVGNSKYSITFAWTKFKEPEVAYRLQLWDKFQGWNTKYWGCKTQVEVGGLGPEECYLFRVGITRPNEQSPLIWSKSVPANTKDDLILVANLHRAVQYGNVNAVRKFISSRPNALDSYSQLGQPILTSAMNPQITTLLLNSGATIDLPSRFTGRTALMQAAAQGQVEVATLLLERGASWHTKDRVGCTALHYAVDTSQLAVVELAISNGANLNIRDSCGWTPLARGVVLGSDVKVLHCLLSAGADLATLDVHGQSTLLLAVLSHSLTSTLILLEHGVTDSNPERLVNIAAAHGDTEIETILREHFQLKVETPKKEK